MKIIAFLTVCALSAAACSSGSSSPDTPVGQWDVTAIADDGGNLAPPVDGTVVTANITDAEIDGSSGCNNYMGASAIDGSTVSFGPFAGTLMACADQAVMDQEQAFLTLLQTVDSWEGTAEGVDLTIDGNLAIQLTATDTSLAGSSWDVTAINNQSGGVQSVVIDSDPTLVFDEDSGVSGATGCNSLTGSYATDGEAIEFSDMALTQMYCEETAEQEVWMMGALADAATYTVNSQTLELFDEGGSRLLTANRQ
jgi:heat shock protein HslJ